MKTLAWLTKSLRGRSQRTRRARKVRHQRAVEQLEVRTLLAAPTNLGQIEGTTYQDLNGNNMEDVGEPGLSFAADGVVVHLFRDGGNGTFDSANGVAGGDDTFVVTANPDANGDYVFAGLPLGDYFVEQPTPTGFIQRAGGDVSPMIRILAGDAGGTAGITIDSFADPVAPQVASTSVSNPHSSFAAVAAIGGERDILAERTGGALNVDFSANAIAGTLAIGSGPGVTGFGVVSWDGIDGSSVVNTTGLAGLDLTNSGQSTGLLLDTGGDFAGTLTVTVHSGANSSNATVAVPAILPAHETFFVPFSSFATLSGTGADFASVGAVEMRIEGPAGFDAEVDLFQTHGPTVTTVDFLNYSPMTIGGTVFRDDNNNGTFGGGEIGVSGVAATLWLDNGNGTFEPGAGDTQVGAGTATGGGGDYSFTNLFPGDYFVRLDDTNFAALGALENLASSTGQAGDTDIDDDDNGAHIGGTTTAIVSTVIDLTNLAEPNIPVDGDDTNANSTIDFGVFGTVDIAVTKSDNVDPVTAGSGTGNLVYTVTATNNGPLDATGVAVTDVLLTSLPTGWTLESAVPTAGTFAGGTGIWTIGNLDDGDSETLTVTITVGTAAAIGTTTNTAAVTAVNEIDSNAANDTANEDTTVNYIVDIAVTKSDNVDPVVAGSSAGNLTYTVTATNNGPSNATGVTVTDALLAALPTGWTLDSATGSGGSTFAGSTWTIGALNAGASETLTAVISVGSSAATGTTTNSATVATVDQTESTTANNTANEDTTVNRQVDIGVTKSDNIDPVTAGSGAGNLVYTVTATNSGPSDATGVTVTDALLASLPTGWTLDSAAGSGGTTFAGTTWTIGDLDSGASETLTVTITVDATAAAGTTTNTVSVASVTETDTNAANDTANENTTVSRQVDVTIAKSESADPITAGSGTGNLVYTLTATNNGPADATGVSVTDALIASLPTGWSFESSTPSTGSFVDGTGVWNIGNLANGGSETLLITLTVGSAAAAGPTTNTAVISANEGETNTGNNTASIDTTAQLVDLTIAKSDNVDPVTAGSGAGNLVYTLTASNNGPGNATGVSVSDALITSLPAGWSFASSTPSTGSFSNTTGVWTIGNLASSATETLTITLTVGSTAAAGTTTNTAVISGNEGETNSANNTTNEDTTVQLVDLAITKTDLPDPVTAGSGAGNLVYTLTATNNGPGDATGVSVSDALITSLPTGWSFAGSTPSTGTFDNGTGIWTIGNLGSGATETLAISLTVASNAAAGITNNTATISGNEGDSNTGNNTATEDTTVQHADVAVVKTENADPITAGSGAGNLVYTIVASNPGGVNATGVTVADALLTSLPTGWTLDTATPTTGTFDNGTGIWTIGNLSTSASETLTVSITVGATAAAITTTNTAVIAANETEVNTANNTSSIDTSVQHIDVAVVKTESADPVAAGSGVGNLIYTLTATNNGPGDATGVTVADALIASLPTGWSFVGATPSVGTFSETTGNWTIGNLANGASATLDITLTIGATAAAGVTTNTAIVSANEGETNTGNNISSVDTTIQLVDVAVTKSDNVDPVTAGSGSGNLVYTLTATNNGPANATGVAVNDALIASLPTGWSFVTSTPSTGTFNNLTGVWSIGNLASGASETLAVTITVGANAAAGTTTNTAVISANEGETTTANNTDSIDTSVQLIDVAIVKTDSADPVIAGSGTGNLVYTLAASNNGPGNATGVTVTDALIASLPTGWSFVSANPSVGAFSEATGLWTIGSLASGSSASMTITLTIGNAAQSVTTTNTAVISANEGETTTANNTSSVTTTVSEQVEIGVVKTSSAATVVAGSGAGNLTYTLTTSNTGISDATGVQITDQFLTALPTGFSIVSATPVNEFNSSTGIWNVGNLNSGASRQLTVVLTVGANAGAGIVSNTAEVTSIDQTGDQPGNNISTVTTNVVHEVDLTVTKTDVVDPVTSPGQITYTVTAVNNGPSIATNVVVTDTLPTEVTFQSAVPAQGAAVESGGVITATLGTIPVGGSVTTTVTVDVDLPFGGVVNNVVAVNGDNEPTANLSNNTATEPTTVNPQLFALSGNVFQDLNGDDIQDQGEQSLDNVLIGLIGTVTRPNGATEDVFRFVRTDANGAYSFAGLLQGEYNVFEVQPQLFETLNQTPGQAGNGDGTVENLLQSITLSSAATPNGATVNNNFTEGAVTETKIDFLASNQFVTPPAPIDAAAAGTIGGQVVLDANGNGIVDAGDDGLFRVPVTLSGFRSDTGAAVAVTALTDADGNYQFTGVPAGTYNLLEDQPTGFTSAGTIDGSLMSDRSQDDAFAQIIFPGGTQATGFTFLERTAGVVGVGAVAPVVAALPLEIGTNPTLEWDPVLGAAAYDVWISQVSGTPQTVYRNQAVAGTSIQVPVDLNLETHRLWVRGMNSNGTPLTSWSSAHTFDVSPDVVVLSPLGNIIDTSPTFDWEDVGGATAYDFILQDSSGAEIHSANDIVGSTYTIPGALSGGGYRFFVRAKNANLTGQWSNGSEFSIGGVPAIVAPVTASVLADPLFQWTDIGATQYEVWVNDVTSGSKFVCRELINGTSMLMDHALTGGNRYRFWVRGMDADGNASAWSSAQTFTMNNRPQVTGPVGNISDSTANITWSPVPGATHYYLWVSDDNGAYIRDQNVQGSQYVATNLPDGNYRTWVQAFGPLGKTAWSIVSKFTVGGLATPILQGPSGSITNRSVTFDWDDVGGAQTYEIWVNHVGVTNRVIHLRTLTDSTFTTQSDLAAGNYRWWVRALGSGSIRSAWSAASDFVIS